MKSIVQLAEKLDMVGSKAGVVAAFMGAFGCGWFLVDMYGQEEEKLAMVHQLLVHMTNVTGVWWLMLPCLLVAGYNHVMHKSLVTVAVRTAYVLPVLLSCMLGVSWFAIENMVFWVPILVMLATLWATGKFSKFLIKLGSKIIEQEYAE